MERKLMTMEQTMQNSLNQSAKVLIQNFINKHFEGKGANKEELINEAVQIAEALVSDVSKDNAISVTELKNEAIDKIKNELATKDFVDRRIAETELKIAELELKMEKRFSKIETYMVAIIILVVVLQPRVFDFLTSIFK